MSQRITARLAPWSTLPTKSGGFTGKVTKAGMRYALNSDQRRKVEFNAVPTPASRGGYFFIDEIGEAVIELRYNDDRDLMMIEVTSSGVKVR